jgi:hypothetical protein
LVAVHIILQIKPCHNKIQQINWTHTQFHETVPNFDHFGFTLKLGIKHGLEGVRRYVDFIDNSIIKWNNNFRGENERNKWYKQAANNET